MVTAIFAAIKFSSLGYRLRAIRENPSAAEVIGVQTTRVKIQAAVFSGSLMAALGTIYAQLNFFFDPDSVFAALQISIRVALITIVGGIGTIFGPIIGALFIIPLEEITNIVLADKAAGLSHLVYGLLLIVIVLMDLVRLANQVLDAIEDLPQIVIAAVNGVVRAGAVELMLACDIRIAADHCRLSMPEARWGCFPGAGAPVRLPVLIGGPLALDLIYTGREIDAQTMERMGLVERLVEGPRLDTEFKSLAKTLAANGPAVLRGAKQIVRTRQRPGFHEARALSDRLRFEFE